MEHSLRAKDNGITARSLSCRGVYTSKEEPIALDLLAGAGQVTWFVENVHGRRPQCFDCGLLHIANGNLRMFQQSPPERGHSNNLRSNPVSGFGAQIIVEIRGAPHFCRETLQVFLGNCSSDRRAVKPPRHIGEGSQRVAGPSTALRSCRFDPHSPNPPREQEITGKRSHRACSGR